MRWVVVGAGSAGCVVAGRLAEAGHDVTVVEAGPATASPPQRSASFFDALAEPGRTYPGPFLRGRGLGGSGAVNGMVATAGDLAQYRSWGWDDAAEALARVRVPLEAAPADELGPLDRALLAAAPDATAVPLCRRAGQRVTAADAYLADVDVELLAGAVAARVELDGDRATGVRLASGRVVAADRVALAAGAIGSPLLLAASGVDRRGLGRGLRNHPGLPVTLRLRPGVAADVHGLVTGTLLRRQDLQILPLNHLGPASPGQAMLLVVAMAPTGSGSVRAGGDGPVVEHGLSDDDRHRLAAGLELASGLLAHDALRDVVADVTVGDAPAGVYHATSTCRMGMVVDDDGAVDGLRGLHVVDASVFPDIPTTNTYLPTLLLAERLAARISST